MPHVPAGTLHGWLFHEPTIHLQAVSEPYELYAADDNPDAAGLILTWASRGPSSPRLSPNAPGPSHRSLSSEAARYLIRRPTVTADDGSDGATLRTGADLGPGPRRAREDVVGPELIQESLAGLGTAARSRR